jgi:methylenetetrahydrofolate reductase (NADPH)
VRNVLALRGDAPAGVEEPMRALEHAIDLVHLVRATSPVHGERRRRRTPRGPSGATSLAEDRRHLAAKLEAADFAVTQFFFEAEDYVRLVEDLAALGCAKPVLPGIMPVTNLAQIERFAALSGATFPTWLAERLRRRRRPGRGARDRCRGRDGAVRGRSWTPARRACTSTR